MPGGRLTLPERREIAAGLAAGLGFAEIARRLQRPTSTVSREVNRNGGHNHYRADHAERAAIRRAGRHRGGMRGLAEKPPDARADPYGRDGEAVRAFEHRFREIVLATGFPRMMAMVLISLYTSDSGSLTATELVERLRVSPASISKAVGHLERLRFARRERDDHPRRERYAVDGDIWDGVWRRQAEAMAEWATTIQEGVDVYGPDTPAGARLHRLSRFLLFHRREMLHAIDRWQQFIRDDRPASATPAAGHSEC